MFYDHLKGPLEALLFASGDPISANRLAKILGVDEENILQLITEMRDAMEPVQRGLTIVEVAGGYQLCTKTQFSDVIDQLGCVQDAKLTAAAMETLSIIAFRQPVTRQEIEQIRGVNVDKIVNQLVERRLVKEMGRKETAGRPILYGTTEEFLQCFGLNTIQDLPDISQFVIEPQT